MVYVSRLTNLDSTMGCERKQIPFTWVEEAAKEGLQREGGKLPWHEED